MRRSLTKEERLRKQGEIKALYASGKSYSCKGLKLWYAASELSFSRVLVSPSRTYDKAVSRNRIKRQAREMYRHLKYRIKPGYDMIFLFYPGEYTFLERQDQMLGLLKRTRLLLEV